MLALRLITILAGVGVLWLLSAFTVVAGMIVATRTPPWEQADLDDDLAARHPDDPIRAAVAAVKARQAAEFDAELRRLLDEEAGR